MRTCSFRALCTSCDDALKNTVTILDFPAQVAQYMFVRMSRFFYLLLMDWDHKTEQNYLTSPTRQYAHLV